MQSKLSQWCDGLIQAGGVAAVIITPLFFNIHSDRVFEPDKITLLRSIALVVAFAWLVKFIDQKGWRNRAALRLRDKASIWQMPFILPVVLLVIVYLISNLLSVTPSVSWAGSYQRLQGTYSTLSYLIIFGALISSMRTRAQARRLITIVIITSIPVAFYGLLQHFNLDPLPWAGNTQDRVAGHMGNAIFLAAYLIMTVPLTLSRIIVSFNNILSDDELATADVIRSSIYIFTLAIQLIAIYWTGSRGPWIGIGIGIFAFVLILLVALRNASRGKQQFQAADAGKALVLVLGVTAVTYLITSFILNALTNAGQAQSLAGPMSSFVAFVIAVGLVVLIIFVMIAAQRGWRWLWFSWILLTLFVGVWLILFNIPSDVTEPYQDTPVIGDMFSTLDEWRGLPRIGRLGRVLEADSGTGRVRILIWDGVLELIEPHEPLVFPDGEQDRFNFLRPLFGYGPESMYVAYNRFYPPELATVEARNASPDRSHNETFDALVITGWFGFIAWQFLYVSAFYFGFRWLDVLRTKRERNLLIAFWFGAGFLTALGFVLVRGPVYAGVAFPFGSIAGLVLYLIYYALFADTAEGAENKNPFGADRMLLVALLAAVLAHYVEIHFGIAIASTRTHFFIYLAIMFVVGYLLPKYEGVDEKSVETEVETAVSNRKGRKRKTRPAVPSKGAPSWQRPIFFSMLMLGLIVGILGFSFTNYAQPPGAEFESIADLPVSEIVQQSMFVDAGEGFRESPFIYVMIVLTWMLGSLLLISEMIKDGELKFSGTASKLVDNRRFLVAGIFAVVGLVGVGYRFIAPMPIGAGSTWLLGRSMMLGWGFLAWLAAGFLVARRESAHMVAGVVAVVGLVGALPVLFAGGVLVGVITAVFNAFILYLLWDKNWQSTLAPAAMLTGLSFIIGFIYIYLHAFLLRNSLFFQPTSQIESMEQLLDFRVLEASQAAGFITALYWFVFLLIILAAFALAATGSRQRQRQQAVRPAYIVLVVAVIIAPFLIANTNLQVIQADMIYKRGRFYDNQASNDGSLEMWDTAIAIYEEAIRRTPREDFYFLFLGRALLERSTVTEDAVEQTALFVEAENRLKEAQSINPLNTDHTANLARLNTRRVATATDANERTERINTAVSYYLDALNLSPQNSVIRNEYARVALDLQQDCDQAIEIFRESLTIDPYYEETYFSLGDVYGRCASALPETERAEFVETALALVEEGLSLEPNNARAWLRAANLYEALNLLPEAIDAYETLQTIDIRQQLAASWRIDMKQAQLYLDLGDEDKAEAIASETLLIAPEDAVPSIQLFLSQLSSAPAELPSDGESDAGGRPLSALAPSDRHNFYNAYPPVIINQNNQYEAVITTENGEMRFRLFPREAPLAVNNFVFLAEQGFYDGTTFHRVLQDFMAQGGDPTGQGGGSPGYVFVNEVDNGLSFDRRGLLAMANAGPDTNGSQFFITFVPVPELTGQYTIFGELLAGDDVLSRITFRDPLASPDFVGDRIVSIDILESGGS
jgi:cyclophilin family peptidyl-prolyl cis-trans isomerase/tetratricopeptide (TPR) repeat protein